MAVGSELQLPAIVVAGIAMRNNQHTAARGQIGQLGIAGRAPELVDFDVTVQCW